MGTQEWYVVVANGEDNSGNPNVDSIVYRWNGTGLEQHQQIATIGASALEVFNNRGNTALAVTSLTDTRYCIEFVLVQDLKDVDV